MLRKATITAAIIAFCQIAIAHADPLFVTGSTFQVQATNSPDTFTDTVSLAPGNHALDGGALNLAISIVPGSGGAEWVVFDYTTTAGGQLSCNGCNWAINQTGIVTTVPVNFVGAYVQWTANGVVQTPTTSIFGGYSVASNPVPGGSGTGLGASGFSAPFNSPLPALGAYMTPWDSYITAMGMQPADINGYEMALEFTPQRPIPEPASLALLGIALLGLAVTRWTAPSDAI